MLKVEVNEGDMKLLAQGSALDLTADVCLTIKELYEKLKFQQAKEFFIKNLKSFIDEGIYKMSGEELAELNRKNIEKAEAKAKEEAEKKEQQKKDFENDVKTMIDLMKKVLEKK